ncbi:hypothetical protein I8D64_03840 [Brachybacterium sp. MASK1Z-5]|uniref:SAV-6107-like HEPN domain-containing protein n=1 Tax=Brachybacterium halotolerans TaxID=2795215 RepID=A0ABS1B7A8_9MICO|nr:SAV_6107 family HEPN domain-containing protein [Brachybacterium halotolerans]MBK0330527.1 hypothetical protein [Brachybacterium halotolerans]
MTTHTAELVHLDQDLAALERAEAMLARAQELAGTDPRASYELVHRAALRTAGVLVTRANRTRRRKLPLNVWTALDRMGGDRRRWAEDASRFVVERDRLDRDQRATPDPVLLALHREGTRARIAQVREELLASLAPSEAVALAG